MHLLPGVAIQPNLELKTQPKQPLGSLSLVIALPVPDNLGNVTERADQKLSGLKPVSLIKMLTEMLTAIQTPHF